MIIKKLCFLGAGLTGGTLASVIALKCPDIQVYVLDQNKEVIDGWNHKKIPVIEPELQEMFKKCTGMNLFFTTDKSCLNADVIFLCAEVNERVTKISHFDHLLEEAARLIVDTVECSKIIVNKSNIAIYGTALIEKIFKAHESPYRKFTVISNPDFLTEGHAVSEILNPDFVLIGTDGSARAAKAVEVLTSLYEHWIPKSSFVMLDVWSAEMTNLARIMMTAQYITGLNSLAEIGGINNVDFTLVIEAVLMQPRFGFKDLRKYLGHTSANFGKTLEHIIHLCRTISLPEMASYWQSVLDSYDWLKQRFALEIKYAFSDNFDEKTVVIMGFPSKHSRDSIAISIAKIVLKESGKLRICNPSSVCVTLKDLEDLLRDVSLTGDLSSLVEIFTDPYKAAKETEAIIICTETPQLKNLNFNQIFETMKKPAYIIDCINQLPSEELQNIGFQVQKLGVSFRYNC